MDTKVTMVGRAVETKVDTERHRGPCRIFGVAIEACLGNIRIKTLGEGAHRADLVRWFCSQFCKNLLRLSLCRKSHIEQSLVCKGIEGFDVESGIGRMFGVGSSWRR